VKVRQKESLSLDFYDQAILSLELTGDDKDIRALLEKVATGERLTKQKVLECVNEACDVEVSIFSIPQPEEEPLDVFDMQGCAEFNSKVWLWPFKGRIEDSCEELKSLCKKRQSQSSAIQSTQKLMEQLRLSQFMGEVINHLTTPETSPQAE
jgi:hypothetical protein